MRLVPPAWDEAETTGLVHGGYWCPKSSEDSFYEVVSFSNGLFYIKASPYYQYFRSGTAAIRGPNSVASTGKDTVARTISQKLSVKKISLSANIICNFSDGAQLLRVRRAFDSPNAANSSKMQRRGPRC